MNLKSLLSSPGPDFKGCKPLCGVCVIKESELKVPVLMYHHINLHSGDTVTVTPEVFSEQMDFLAQEGYKTLSADELLAFIRGEVSFRQKAVAITFDDGWLDNYLYAVSVLKKYQFKATFFVITARVDSASKQRMQAWKDIPDHETAKQLIHYGEAERVVLGWHTINELEKSGFFRFYSHTVTHRRCSPLSPLELQLELIDSKASIEKELGNGCDYLCWPYGSSSPDTVSAAKDAGYKAIFTTIDGFCEFGADPYMIRRIEVENSVQWLKARLSEDN